GRAISTAVKAGGGEAVHSGGTASFTTVSSGGQSVDAGGTTFGTTLLNGNSAEYVYSGGRAVSTTVGSSSDFGGEYLLDSATASDTTLNDGGIEVVSAHARAISTTVNSGGVEAVLSGAVLHDPVLNSGGAIDVSYMPFVAGGSVSVNSSGLLTVSVGGQTYTQQLAGEYARIYALSPDTVYYGGTDITAEAPCFRGGTHIMTDRGDVAVEDLAVGDLVPTVLGGTAAPIIWIGRRQVDCAHHPKTRQVWPIRVAAGAFGPGQPHTDLFLSPDHAVYVNEVLIPVKHLINGSTIVQVPVERVTYYHIELPRHDVLLAEGLPAESFLDMRDGSNYANRPGPVRLYSDFSARIWEAFGCARLIVTGPELVAARAFVGRFAAERDAA
ncbi:MAG TPA: Hint domain-containing protein, partial [Acetobacteraceae bacterium]|nr:Hint domain-containing protein [Acetobacteraceae bacterium]